MKKIIISLSLAASLFVTAESASEDLHTDPSINIADREPSLLRIIPNDRDAGLLSIIPNDRDAGLLSIIPNDRDAGLL
ncbi:hypothetical protein ACQKGI_21670 [Peribacillus muralis]|uniref:hypothetical protein n=1 Tax=Peribacillus muralis TaxID=264697 RepID=UPI0038299EB8